jgi:hypothetical protein
VPLGVAEAPWSMDGAALDAGAPADGTGAPLGRLGPYDQAGRDEAGAQATTPNATRPPPATAALWRNPRRVTVGGSAVVTPSRGADSVGLGVGWPWGVVVSMRRMVCLQATRRK